MKTNDMHPSDLMYTSRYKHASILDCVVPDHDGFSTVSDMILTTANDAVPIPKLPQEPIMEVSDVIGIGF
jgi:alpha-ketoglutarate-dependent taurine dioxygenase